MTETMVKREADRSTGGLQQWWRDWLGEDPVMVATSRWYTRPPEPVGQLISTSLQEGEMTLGLQAMSSEDGLEWWLGVTNRRVFICGQRDDPWRWQELGPKTTVKVEAATFGRDSLMVGTRTFRGDLVGSRLRELVTYAGKSPARRFTDVARLLLESKENEAALVLSKVALDAAVNLLEPGEDQSLLVNEVLEIGGRAAVLCVEFEALDEMLCVGFDFLSSKKLDAIGQPHLVPRGVWLESLGHALFAAESYRDARKHYQEITRHRPDLGPWQTWCLARCADELSEPSSDRVALYESLRDTWRSDPIRIAPDGRDWMFESGRALPDVLLRLSRAQAESGRMLEAKKTAQEALERAPLNQAIVNNWLLLGDQNDEQRSRVEVCAALMKPQDGIEPDEDAGLLFEPVTWGGWLEEKENLLLHPGVRGWFGKLTKFVDRQFAEAPSTANLHFLFRVENEPFRQALDDVGVLLDDDDEVDPRLCLAWRGLESRPHEDGTTYLLVGTPHFEEGNACFLTPTEWRFVLAGQCALIRHGAALIGSEEYKSALLGALIELGPAAFGFVPVVGKPVEKAIVLMRRWWGRSSDAARFVSKVSNNAVASVWGQSSSGKSNTSFGKTQLAERALWSLCSADRYGLLAVGDLHAAIRGILLTSRYCTARAAGVGVESLENVLGLTGVDQSKEEAAELIQIQVRVSELIRFVVSSELEELLVAARA